MDPFWLARKGKETMQAERKEGAMGVAGLTEDMNTSFHAVTNTLRNLQLPISHASLQNEAKTISRAGDTGALCSDDSASARFLNCLIPHNHVY